MHSKDKTQENFEILQRLFPNAVTEAITGYDEDGKAIVERAIDKDVLQQEINAAVVEGKDERYQFTWPDKKRAIVSANAPINKTLRPCREESVDFDNTENLYIEGDNLEVLKLLQETYLGKIKMIYIDPPYNTGTDGFVYNDKFKFTAEAYFKALSNLIPYSVSNVKVVYYGNNECKGHAMGIDFKLYGEFVPGTDFWISFSIMNTRMKLNGHSIPLPTDQRYSLNLYFTDYFPGTERWKMSLKLAYADGLPFYAPHQELETHSFRAPAYKRADIGMSFLAYRPNTSRKSAYIKSVWLGLDCLNLFGISNVNSYYWVTDVTNQQYAVPNYLTGRQLNFRVNIDF